MEHDEETIVEADYVIDIGPGSGDSGGHVVFEGTPIDILTDSTSVTGPYLSGTKKIFEFKPLLTTIGLGSLP